MRDSGPGVEFELGQLGALVAHSGDFMAIAGMDGQLMYLNPTGQELAQFSDLAAVQRASISALFAADIRAEIRTHIASAIRDGRGWTGAAPLQAQGGGTSIPMLWDLFVLPRDEGHPRRLALVGRDQRKLLAIETVVAQVNTLAAGAAGRRAVFSQLRADVSAALVAIPDKQQALQRCCEALVTHLGVAFARIWLADEAEETLVLTASAGLYTHVDGAHGRVPIGQFKIGKIAADRRPHLTNSVQGDPRVPEQAWAREHGLVSFAGYPLTTADRLLGVVAMFSRQPLDDEIFHALSLLADIIAHGVRRHAAEALLIEQASELQRANGDLSQFAYVASHDLQEPLRTITNYLGMFTAKNGDGLDDKSKRYLAHVTEASARMQALIRDLLQLSQASHEVGTAGQEVADVKDAVTEALINLEQAIIETGAVISIGDMPTIPYFHRYLGQLFQNLIGNALKYRGSEAPQVQVEAERVGDEWIFSVRDNGLGIDPVHHKRIFEVFQRLHARTDHKGTGIGLALCEKIVRMHGGRIWVDSALGHGSTFRFSIPSVPADSPSPIVPP